MTLNFENAGLFRRHKGTKDKIFDNGEIRDRAKEWEFKEPITVYQIANVIHVLFGKAPVPSHRHCFYTFDDYLFDKALNSYLKIDSYVDQNGKFYEETVQLTKSMHNAWWPNKPFMNWEVIRKLLGNRINEQFINVLAKGLKCNPTDFPYNDIEKKILTTTDEGILEFLSKENLLKLKKTPLRDLIFSEDKRERANINKNARTRLTVSKCIDKIARLDGQIMIPVSDEDIEVIRVNKGCATILEEGMVTIKDIKHQNLLNPEGFTLVSDISTDKQ